MAVLFWYLLKSVFCSFQFPLYMSQGGKLRMQFFLYVVPNLLGTCVVLVVCDVAALPDVPDTPIVHVQRQLHALIYNRRVCGHPAPTSSFTKYNFLQVNIFLTTKMNVLSVLKLFRLSNGDLLFS